jgi:hypothetical protein
MSFVCYHDFPAQHILMHKCMTIMLVQVDKSFGLPNIRILISYTRAEYYT